MDASNPLLADWAATEPFGLPPFTRIQTHHFKPALEYAFPLHLQDVSAIAANLQQPNFTNTIAAFDRIMSDAGALVVRVQKVFENLCSSNSPPELQAVQMEMAPIFSSHNSKIYTTPGLWPRIETVYSTRLTAGLSLVEVRLVERIWLDFVREGARFDIAAQQKYMDIMSQLSTLTTSFQQNVMADESLIYTVLKLEDLAGCPTDLISSAREAAVERNCAQDEYAISLSRSLVVPFLTFSTRRDLREKIWRLWTSRGETAGRDNRKVAIDILALRIKQAQMHGFESFAAYQTSDTMAQCPRAVMDLLERVWAPAKVSADRERQALEEFLKQEDTNAFVTVEAWDWRFYAEKVRQQRYDFDEGQLKPFFSLERMVEAVFDTAFKLFGLRFVPRPDIISYHKGWLLFGSPPPSIFPPSHTSHTPITHLPKADYFLNYCIITCIICYCSTYNECILLLLWGFFIC